MADDIQLNKPLWEGGGPAKPKTPQEKAMGAPPRMVPVFAGFWTRFMALTIDVMVISIIHKLLVALRLNEPLYAMKALAPLIGMAALFVMLVIVPARIWPGQTLGKRLLRLRLVDGEANDPPFQAYVQRFIVLIVVLVPGWLMGGSLEVREAMLQHPLVGGAITGIVYSLILTQISLFILHPCKRGFHDLWAGTYVVRLDNPDPHPAHAIAMMDQRLTMRIRQASRMATIMLPVLTVVFAFQVRNEELSPRRVEVRELRLQVAELAGPGAMVGHQVLTPRDRSPESHMLIAKIPPLPDVAWSDIASSEAQRAIALQVVDLLQAEYNIDAMMPENTSTPPRSATLTMVADEYTLIPGVLMLGRIAAAERTDLWVSQELPISMINGGVLPGHQLTPFSVTPEEVAPASPEATAVPASPEG